MKISARRLKDPVLIFGFSCLLSSYALADHSSMSCDGRVPSTHAPLAEGDQSVGSHLHLSRPISRTAEVNIDVCAAELTITGSKDNNLQVTVDIGSPSGKLTAADYLETFDATPNEVRLQLHLPRSVHAKVRVEIPAANQNLQTNLARGNLVLVADQVSGERKFNVGYGHVDCEGNKDVYESMQVNVGLGSLHDHRRDGESHHLIVAHSFAGTGKGSIEINVGMGSVDLNPGQSKPI